MLVTSGQYAYVPTAYQQPCLVHFDHQLTQIWTLNLSREQHAKHVRLRRA